MSSPARAIPTPVSGVRHSRPTLVPAAERPGSFSIGRTLVLLVWTAVAAGLLWYGLDYYRLPLAERAFNPLHDQLKPSGTLGLTYGVLGTACMTVGVALYSLRRRAGWLGKLGRLKGWLSLHVFLCTMGPFLILLHTSFKFGGLVSIAFWSMVAVATSGAFGRYVYVRVPRSLNGQMLSLKATEERREALLGTIAQRSGLRAPEVQGLVAMAKRRPPRTLAGALVRSLWDDLTEPWHARRVRRLLEKKGVPPRARATTVALFREEAALERRVALIRPFQRLFRYWHLFHLPLAILMAVIVLLHIGVAVALGYRWLF